MKGFFFLPYLVSTHVMMLGVTVSAVAAADDDVSQTVESLLLPGRLYVLFGMFHVLRISMNIFFPNMIAGSAELSITFTRIVVRFFYFIL